MPNQGRHVEQVLIVPSRREHVEQMAALHCQSVPSLLSTLGVGVTRAVYEGYLRSDALVGFVCLKNDSLQGFVVGSAAPGRFRKEALRRNLWRIGIRIVFSVLRRPTRFGPLLAGIREFAAPAPDTGTAELTYIGVSSDARRAGVGTRLMDAFDHAMRRARIHAYELSVDEANVSAIHFYEARGFRQVGEYSQFGALYRRYELAVNPISTEKVE